MALSISYLWLLSTWTHSCRRGDFHFGDPYGDSILVIWLWWFWHQLLFNGNTESLFYAIYKQGGKKKHALEFNGLDALFLDKQFEKIYSEIDKKYGRSYYEIRKNRDILAKVVVPEICIKLYMVTFNIEDKSIALNMIRNTPIAE